MLVRSTTIALLFKPLLSLLPLLSLVFLLPLLLASPPPPLSLLDNHLPFLRQFLLGYYYLLFKAQEPHNQYFALLLPLLPRYPNLQCLA